ncbi:type I-MYXAN CRISPR-associated protein Cas6/Cmx6 [uncultured Thiohalocapsa sp.]|uniref:type I-MYXAN CRISPR-associated protein Cas6/Cmx6 n=1 Tax=uncultured Thiohalocapsa sp. TaxID=768990 RepID=UPI0025CCD36A|nr:type I-MYXAN CRISPR-associated protein Cas6/Cmx6 [uncultured Thiohalocapsa sp.]
MPLDDLSDAYCTLEAAFPLRGDPLPADHGAALFDALCHHAPLRVWLAATDAVAIAPIRGRADGHGGLILTDESQLLMRLATEDLPRALRLAGGSVNIQGRLLDIGEPRIQLPRPATTLSARLVVFDGGNTRTGASAAALAESLRTAFAEVVNHALAMLEISGKLVIGAAGQLQMLDRSVPGFSVQIHGLTPEDSLHLQEAGLGDHRKLGCGVFLPG